MLVVRKPYAWDARSIFFDDSRSYPLLDRCDVNTHGQDRLSSSKENALDWHDIAVVAADCDSKMIDATKAVVGRVHVDPS